MLFTLGQRARSGDVVDLLLACHHRIREHLALARRLAHAPALTTADAIRAAAERVRRYFAEAFPQHRADEEEDLFPRLLGRSDDLDVAIGRLCHDHGAHDRYVASLLDACAALERDPGQLHALAERIDADARALEDELLAHIMLEERTVFPAIALLSAEDKAEIVARMRARRGTT